MTFWRLVNPEQLAQPMLTGSHNHTLSFYAAALLAILAAWVLLPVADRYHAHAVHGRWRYFWLGAGSLAMGVGIWAMHFTSMLVFHLPFPLEYDLSVTILSIIPAALASGSTIILYEAACQSRRHLHLCALCMALGIGTMHYLGMEAIRVPAEMYYLPDFFLLSLAAAYVMAVIGLEAKIRLSQNPRLPRVAGNLAGSVILGLAVTSMHFLAMRATYFVADAGLAMEPDHTMQPVGLVGSIVLCTILLLGFILLGTLVDRRLDRMAASLKQSELRFQRLAETTQMAIFSFNEHGVTYANPALHAITGFTPAKLAELSLGEVFGLEFQDFAREILGSNSPFGQAYYEQFEIRTAKGESRWLYFSVTLAEVDKRAACLASACDISDQKSAELTMRRLAYTDQLTQLGNRAMFIDRLQHHLCLLARRKLSSQSCVMLLDLDNFKMVNDTYGHLQGDQLLQDVANRLKPLARQTDSMARLGGDEFVILVEEMNTQHNVSIIAERILRELTVPFMVGSRELKLNTSIGVVTLEADEYQTPDEVLHDVDIALYRAKGQGRACWVLYDEELDSSVKRSRLLLADLRSALANDELQLVYQPIFAARTRELRGFEVLARWQRACGEWVSPGEFIPLAEENGMIADLTLRVIECATGQLGAWNREFAEASFYLSVNVSTDSFNDERFIKLIAACIERHGIRRGQLKLEITERMLVTDMQETLAKLDKLIELGCELMIDDFGTGYSSLAYLNRLPVRTLKIDRSFVLNMECDESSRSVIKSIIGLARNLDMDVISEGVETEEQLQLLTRMGAHQLQGYLLGKPEAAASATRLLAGRGRTGKLLQEDVAA